MSDESGNPPTPSDDARLQDELQAGSRYIHDAYSKVREIGKGRRWYDFPYKLAVWLSSSWPRKIIPWKWRIALRSVMNRLIPFHEHDVHKAWRTEDPSTNLRVPRDEHVTIPGIWIVELFPPSEAATLGASIARNSWNGSHWYMGFDEHNQKMLERARGGYGWEWWRLADIVRPNSRAPFPDSSHDGKLPRAFAAVELEAMQIGSGMTAVFAYFHLTAEAARSVDAVWHEKHEPQLVRQVNRRAKAEDRKWAAFRLTQASRRSLHDAAREWLSFRCPGFFAGKNEPQPLLDLMLFDQHDPMPGERENRAFAEALRALGLDSEVLTRTSPDLPRMLLSPLDTEMCPTLSPRTWTLWGNRDTIASAHGELNYYGTDSSAAIAHIVSKRMRNFFCDISNVGLFKCS